MASGRSFGDRGLSMRKGAYVLFHHDDPPPGALAHGAIKTTDIERVRGDIAQAAKDAAGTALARRAFHAPSLARGRELRRVRLAGIARAEGAVRAPERA